MSQFVTALELATYFNGTTDEADLSADWVAQANLLLQMISADVEEAAGVPIAGTGTHSVKLAGTWSRDLELPAGPISSVVSVALNGTDLGADQWTWNERSTIRRGGLGLVTDYDEDDDFDQGAREGGALGWGGPVSTVSVVYTAPTATPAIVKSLVLRIAARTFGNVSDITQESLAIYSVTYGKSRTDSGSHVTAAERRRLRRALNRTGGTIVATGV